MTLPQTAAIYVRISDDREGRELGVERQEEDARALAARLGYDVRRVYKDNDLGASTRSKKPRPDYERMLRDARAGQFSMIVAYASGRLTRRPREHEGQIELAEQHGIEFRYVASPNFDLNTSAGRRVARILAANDAGEAEDIGERVSRQKQQLAQAGGWTGGRRPFGYEDDAITIRPTEQEPALDAARRLLADDSARSIFIEWNAAGMTTTAGGQWDGSNFRQMMLRPRNAGRVGKIPAGTKDFRKALEKLPKSKWAPLFAPKDCEPDEARKIAEDLWVALAIKLTDPERRTNRGGSSLALVGSHLFLCWCGQLERSGGTTADGKARYMCKAGHTRIAEPIDRLVRAVVCARLDDQKVKLLPKTNERGPIMERLARLEARAQEAAALFGDPESGYTAEQFKATNARLRPQIDEAKRELAQLYDGSALDGIANDPSPSAAFLSKSIERQRAIIGTLVKVTILKVPPGRHAFDPTSVEILPL